MIAAEFTNIDLLMVVVIIFLLISLVMLAVAEMGLSRMSKPRATALADKGLKSGKALKKLPGNHPLYRSFFKFDGPPTTGFELNGWGDDLVHDYLRGIEIDGRLGVLYSNKDYGCEWDYDWRNKRFQREDNTKFGVNLVVYAMTS